MTEKGTSALNMPQNHGMESGPLSPSVLIVDDEDAMRRICADFAEDAGLRSRSVSTTEEALEVLEANPIDIVLTDLKVPRLGGLELLRHVRESFPQTAVVVLTQFG
ncbi:MAG TPA: response regulator, partial [Candidatus Acidoferrales bacterium]|nr:response regulator [Candidatus Acidoferrales bacterium]